MTEADKTHPDYVDGYLDGRDLDSPGPTDNRSARYKHSFAIGRAERLGEDTPQYQVSMRRVTIIEEAEKIQAIQYERENDDR